MSGLFRSRQINWACLTKEAYVIYMSIKKLAYYLEDADVTVRSASSTFEEISGQEYLEL